MSPIVFIARQWIVSFVVLSTLQCSSAMRLSRPIVYPAPSVRKYFYPWKYVPFAPLPRSMQRRFMWKEMDDTVDGLMDGVTTGARAMTHMFTPPLVRYRKPLDFETQSTSKVKYVLKKPPPFKRMKVVKLRAPKKPVHIYKGSSSIELSSPISPPITSSITSSINSPINSPITSPITSSITSSKSSPIVPFMSEKELRKIEKEQEMRVESGLVGDIHEHSHQTHMDHDVVSGRINEFGEGWLPIKTPYATSKPFVMSNLRTKVMLPTPVPSDSEPFTAASLRNFNSYEVTEHSADESIQRETSFQPSNHFEFLSTTTEMPNYPEHFLKTIQESQTFRPQRVRIPITSTTTTTTTSLPTIKPTLSNRLPPRSTTERPFKRYNLHRPKSSKIFFSRPPSSPVTEEQIQTATTSKQSIALPFDPQPNYKEPIKATEPPAIRTTRESPRITTTTTTTTSTSKPPPEKVRNTRNNSEAKSKLRIKNVSQNEDLKKVLNKHRGTVKFGEKQS